MIRRVYSTVFRIPESISIPSTKTYSFRRKVTKSTVDKMIQPKKYRQNDPRPNRIIQIISTHSSQALILPCIGLAQGHSIPHPNEKILT